MANRPKYSSKTGIVYRAKTNHLSETSLREELKEDSRVFNNIIHETEIHVPQPILNISELDNDLKLDNCLDMPVRLMGEEAYHIPDNWKPLWSVLKKVIDFEHAHNENWKDYYTYLTVDYSDGLKVGEQQRRPGAHTDGFQGVRVKERTKTSRSYVAVTNGGTYYYPQTFVANLDASKFDVFKGFDKQIHKDDNDQPIREVAEEKIFYFFDAYTVHESGGASRDGSRLFIRLTWEQKLFDRHINTKNSMIDYDWTPEPYDIRDDLVEPSLEDIEEARLVK